MVTEPPMLCFPIMPFSAYPVKKMLLEVRTLVSIPSSGSDSSSNTGGAPGKFPFVVISIE